jgi:hypothetical protein
LTIKVSKSDKILYTIFRISNGKAVPVKFEDIIVETYKTFKKDFNLINYPQYPDSDIFRREIYFGLRQKGFITINNRICLLTNLGISRGNEISLIFKNKKYKKESNSKIIYNNEIKRIIQLPGFQLYLSKQENKLIDKDFYDLYKATVRTPSLELLGKISQLNNVISELRKKDAKLYEQINNYSEFLKIKYSNITREKSNVN